MTTDIDEIKRILFHKDILLDNNILTRATDHPDAFFPFLQLIETSACNPMITGLIQFEYLRGAYQLARKKKRQAFLQELAPGNFSHNFAEQKMELAIKIGNCYSAKQITPSVVDCSLASHLIAFGGRLLLATLNHKDFPIFLFDRLAVFTIDTEKEVLPIGIYGFNKEKAEAMDLRVS